MARRTRCSGLGSLGNVSATKALQSFIVSVRAATSAAQRASASQDPETVLTHARVAKIALAQAEAAAGILKTQAAFHSDYRAALRQAQSAVEDAKRAEDNAARDARSSMGPDAYDRTVDGLAGLFGFGRRKRRKSSRRRRLY